MTMVKGDKNSWQVGYGRPEEQQHIIAKCGSHTGHFVRGVAFCDTAETAEVLVEALRLLKEMHDDPDGIHSIKPLLERAGLL